MKKKHIGKRMLAIFFALAFCLTLLPLSVMAATEYAKDSDGLDTDASYVIIGTRNNAKYALKVSGNGVTQQAVTIDETNHTIMVNGSPIDGNYIWKWETGTASGKYTLYNSENQKYLSASNTSLALQSGKFDWGYDTSLGLPTNPNPYYTAQNYYICKRLDADGFAVNASSANYYAYADFYKVSESGTTSYNITITPPEHGTVSVDGGATTAAEGEEVTLIVSPADGYQLKTLSVTSGGDPVSVNNNKFSMPAGDVTVAATFEEIPPTTYNITITPPEHGTVSVDGGATTATAGTIVSLIVTPDSGYKLGTLTATSGGNSVAVENNSFTMPAADVTVTATFVEDTPVVVAQKAYKEVTSLTAGKNYLIASGNSDTVQLLSYASGSLGKVEAEVENGIIELSDPASCVWTVDGTANTDFQLVNQGTTYLTGRDSLATSTTRPSRENDSWKWDTTNAELGFGNNGASHLRFHNNDFVITIYEQGDKVHLFEEIPTFSAHQLVLTGQLGLIFKMDLSCLTADEIAAGTMSFSINSGDPVEVAGTAEGNGKYAFTCVVNALQMADTIMATYTYGEGKTVTDTYSVNAYLNEILESNNAALVKYQPLAEAIKDYGHYAQTYLAGVHDFEIGTDYTAMDAAHDTLTTLTDDQLTAIKPSLVKGESGVSGLAIKLSLESETALTIRPVVSGSDAAEGTVSFLGNTIDFESGKVVVPNIKAAQLAEKATISATVGGKALSGEVSALSYAYVVLKDNSSSADLKNLAIALYNYYAEISKL